MSGGAPAPRLLGPHRSASLPRTPSLSATPSLGCPCPFAEVFPGDAAFFTSFPFPLLSAFGLAVGAAVARAAPISPAPASRYPWRIQLYAGRCLFLLPCPQNSRLICKSCQSRVPLPFPSAAGQVSAALLVAQGSGSADACIFPFSVPPPGESAVMIFRARGRGEGVSWAAPCVPHEPRPSPSQTRSLPGKGCHFKLYPLSFHPPSPPCAHNYSP